MTMDVQIALVSVGLCVLSGVVVYLISVFGMKEKTYEEAIEEQRRRNQEALVKIDKPKKEKKYKKTQSKKKDKTEDEPAAQPQIVDQSSHHGVDFKSETEIIPVEAEAEQTRSSKATSRSNSSSKKKNTAPPKSILVNKQEPTPSSVLTPPIEEDQEDALLVEPPPPAFVPMDEVERRHSLDAGTVKRLSIISVAAEPKEKPVEKSPEKKKKEEPSPTKKIVNNNYKRNKSDEVEGEAPSGKKLLSWLKSSQLQDDEIQLLIDVLLNKQHQGTAEWTKRNDPLTQLKKQLQERDAALEAEQRQSAAVNAKMRDMRHELGTEKSQRANTDRLLKEKLALHTQEVQALQARLQHQHDQHLQESTKLQAKLQQMQSKVSDEQELALQHLSEENSKLQQKLARVDAERQNWTALEGQLQMKLKQMQSACEHYEAAQVGQQQEREKVENRVQQLLIQQQEEEYKFGQRMNELSSQLAESEGRCASMAQETSRVREAERGALVSRVEKAEAERGALVDCMEKTKVDRAALIARVDKADATLKQKEQDMAQLIETLEKEKSRGDKIQSSINDQLTEAKRLSAALSEENQRLKTQLAEKLNGQVQENTSIANEKNKVLEEKERLVASLEELVQRGKNQLATVAQELENQKKKNNELREKNWKVIEVCNKAEKDLKDAKDQEQDKIALFEKKLEEVTKAAEEKFSVAQKAASELSQRVKEERNKEREALATLLSNSQIDSQLDHGKWLEQFVTGLRQKLASTTTSNTSSVGELTQLRGQNGSLQVQVTHYKTVLAETEDILKKLQSGVESQERSWQEKLTQKEEQLLKALEEKKKLEKNLEELQGIEEATSEMQSRLKELQSKLQGEENEKKSLEDKYEQVNSKSSELSRELSINQQELEVLRKEKETLQKQQQELELLHSQLEKERKTTKDLSSQTVKLNSLVKIGQDALKAEQDLVKELHQEIEALKNNNAPNKNGDLKPQQQQILSNGPPPPTSPQSEGASGKK